MKFLSFSKLFGAGWRGNGKKKHAAKSVLRSRVQLRLEELEDRTTPSVTDVLPSVLTSPTTASDLGAGYGPQIVIDPVNPLKMVEIHSTGSTVAGSYTTDGGQTWQAMAMASTNTDPSTGSPFAVVESPSVTFDRGESIYVVSSQHNVANTSGAIVLQKLSFTTNTPTLVSLVADPPPTGTDTNGVYQDDLASVEGQIRISGGGTGYSYTHPSSSVTTTIAGNTTLNNAGGGITNSATTFDVASAATFAPYIANLPGTPFYITVESEIMRVTAVSGTTFTVVRGQAGTSAAVHVNGVSIYGTMLATDTTMYVVSNAGFPTSTPFTVNVDSEVMRVTSTGSGTDWTVQRGWNFTTAAIHNASTTVFGRGPGQALDQGKVVVYRWSNQNPGANPVVGVDTNLTSYTDPLAGTALADSMANMVQNVDYNQSVPKAVYVAWAEGNQVVVAASADGGNNFSTPETLGGGTSPQILFTQGWRATTLDLPTTAGAGTIIVASGSDMPATSFTIQIDDEQMTVSSIGGPNNAFWSVTRGVNGTTAAAHAIDAPITIVGGDLMFFWNTGGGVAMRQAKPDLGDASTPVTATADFTFDGALTDQTNNTGRIVDALKNAVSGLPDVPKTTTFTSSSITISGTNWTPSTLITDFNVTINLYDKNLDGLRIQLIAPDNTTITLVRNHIDGLGNAISGQGLTSGANLGMFEVPSNAAHGAGSVSSTYTAGTTFDSESPTSIQGGTGNYVGNYRPEVGTLSSFFSGKTASQMSGQWTLVFTDVRDNDSDGAPAPPLIQFLDSWSLHFTGILDDSTANVAGALGTTSGVAGAAPNAGSDFSVAIDKTVSGFSQFQGRIYVAYAGTGTSTAPGDAGDIYLVYSNDNGKTWSNPNRVNADTISDSRTEGIRTQMVPSIAVDQTTGTLIITYYDASGDAANVRYAAAVVASVDGGENFSSVSYLNQFRTATNFLTGDSVDYGPIGGNLSQAGTYGFGTRQGVVAYAGKIYSTFSTNLNAAGAEVYAETAETASGPRVVYGDMGTVTADFSADTTNSGTFYYNNTTAADGTRQITGFVVQFDRPVDISTFDASDVLVKYQNPYTGTFSNIALDPSTPITALDTPSDTSNAFGVHGVGIGVLATTFYIKFLTPQSAVGTYSYAIGPNVFDRQRTYTSVSPIDNASTTLYVGWTTGFPTPNFTIKLDNELMLVTGTGATTASTTLNGSISSTDTTINVQSSVNFPTGNFDVTIGAEKIHVVSVSGNTWTVERGQSGTTPAAHLNGDLVTANLNYFTVQRGYGGSPITAHSSLIVGTVGNAMDQNANSLKDEGTLYEVGTLAASAGATSLVVNSSQERPKLNSIIQIDSEQMQVTAVNTSTNTWTVTRAVNGTSLAAHDANTAIRILGDATWSNQTTTINMPSGNPSGLSKTALTMTVASNANFASIPTPFTVQIEDEQILVTGRFGPGNTDWTIVRGWNGTDAAAHGNGAVVNSVNSPDIFSVPTALPTGGTSGVSTGVPFSGSYDSETLPLVIPGAHIVSSSVPGATVESTTIVQANGIGANDTTVTVAAGTNFPTSEYAATIGNEKVWVTAVNYTITTLNGGISSSDLTMTVQSSAKFPAANFDVIIDSEQIHVVSVAGNTWTVLRAQNGTTAASHSSGASVIGADPMRTLTITRGFAHTTAEAHNAGTTLSVGDSSDNLILNGTVNAIDVTFDRDINAATFTAADVVSISGPAGAISGPFTVTQPILGNNRTFRIGFTAQTLSGSYSVVLGSGITDTLGNLVDSNLNVGIDVLRGVSDPTKVTLTRPVYSTNPAVAIAANSSVSTTISISDVFNILQATTQSQFTNGQTTTIAQSGGITASDTTFNVLSSVNFPSTPFIVLVGTEQMKVTNVSGTTWTVQRGVNGTTAAAHANGSTITLGQTATIEVMLNIGPDGNNNLDIRDLKATLTGPDSTTITLFNKVGQFGSGSRTSFSNTVFDDSASTPIQLASVPITGGPFNPQDSLTNAFDGKNAAGNWTLTITNTGSTTGFINHFELRLPKAVPNNGLGETIADQSTVSFRIFTQSTNNAQSSKQWTAVGPSGNVQNPDTNGDNAGSVTTLAVDPSDPSGNTVYVGAASGGIWKTTNYLTNDPNGPTWIALTDLGPTMSLNVGSITIIGRNSDPSKSIILATTGNGTDTITQTGSPSTSTTTKAGATGVGLLRSMDGGKTWQVLDGTNNVDGSGNILAINSASRTHTFVGATGNKVVADTTPQANGTYYLYAAFSGTNGGIYRSSDTGNTWTLIKSGNATDLVLAAASTGTTGNLDLLYGAFQGDGVYKTVGSATVTITMTKLSGLNPFITRVDLDSPSNGNDQVTVNNTTSTPNGNNGLIVLAVPSLMNNPLGDSFYKQWLYAAVSNANGTFNGLYVTKDGGSTWTKLNLPTFTNAGLTFPTNNETRVSPAGDTRSPYDPVVDDQIGTAPYPTTSTHQNLGNYSLTITVDPNDPEIIYLGGTSKTSAASMGSMFRIDTSKLDDPYKLMAYSNDEADGGLVQFSSTGQTIVKFGGSTYGVVNQFDPGYVQNNPATWSVKSNYTNLYREPTNPFRPATLQFTNVDAFNNSGTDVFWMPINNAIDVSQNQHQVVAVKDSITGGTRLYFANDQGTYTGVHSDTGAALESIGAYSIVTGSRNGNLQIAQMYDSASEPSTLAAELSGAMFYGAAAGDSKSNANNLQYPSSTLTILTTGDLRWSGNAGDGTVDANQQANGLVSDAVAVATDQGGSGQVYNTIYSSTIKSPLVATDFFQSKLANALTAAYISGLVSGSDNPGINTGEWPQFQASTFAVNSIDPNAVVMGSHDGHVYMTTGNFTGGGTNLNWVAIANPGDLDGTYASALAFGSRNATNNHPSDLIYVGTTGGKIYVTYTAGGWRDISSGLDGGTIEQIVTNPKPGSYEAYAVTTTGVFWMQDAGPNNASPKWIKISDNTVASTTITQASGITATDTAVTVASTTGFPATPFVAKIGSEMVLVTAVNNTTTTLVGAIDDTQTTINVASSALFPSPNFVIQIGTEQMQVTGISGNTWTVTRGFNSTTAAAHANSSTITGASPMKTLTITRGYSGSTAAAHANSAGVTAQTSRLFSLSKGNFNNNGDQIQTLQYLTSIQVDWRYAIPDTGTAPTTTINQTGGINASDTTMTVASSAGFPSTPFVVTIGTEQIQVTNVSGTTWTLVRGYNGTTAAAHADADTITQYGLTHPVVYVGGNGGIFRSRDNGITWTYFPNVSTDGASQEGGYLPNTNVTSLNLILGNVNSSTGFADASTGLNMLMASTYGRGDYVIRLDNSAIAQYVVAPISGAKVVSQTLVLATQGTQLAGFQVQFGSTVDPNTFNTSDVTVIGPNGAVSVASVVDISGGAHDLFQINFTSIQSTVGNYTLKVGPNVLDFSGDAMNQNGNNLNGENPGDVYSNTFFFTPNTAPTITITDIPASPLYLNPGGSGQRNVTVGDAQDSANVLVVTTSSSNTTVIPNGNIVVGGSGANRTISVTAPVAQHGSSVITVTVTDSGGLFTSTTFTVDVDNAPTMDAISSPQTAVHGSTPTNFSLNVNDADGDSVTATVSLTDPIYTNVSKIYGLYSAELTQYYNYNGAREKFFLSSNGSNAANGGYYILMPTNKLYAWLGSLSATLAQSPVADFTSTYANVDVYANPALMTSFDPLATLRATYGLNGNGQLFNFHSQNEWYFQSSNGSNSANGGWYVLMPTNKLYAWMGTMTATLAGTPVADFLTAAYSNYNVYNDPLLLKSLGAVNDDPRVTVDNPLYDLKVKYGLDTAAQYFNLRGANEWYLHSSNGSNPNGGGGWYILLPNNTLVAWHGSISNYTLVADLSSYGNVYANPTLLTSAKPGLAVGVTASVSPNPITSFPDGTLTITPTAGFERSVIVTVSLTDALSAPVLQTFTYTVTNSAPTMSAIGDRSIAHNNSSDSLNVSGNVTDTGDNSTKVYSVEVSGNGSSYPIDQVAGQYGLDTANQYTNNTNHGETYFHSSNGSNAGNGGWYVLTSDSKLYAWAGTYNATTTGLTSSPYFVADFLTPFYGSQNVSANPSLLYNARKAAAPAVNVNRGPLYDVKVQYGLDTADQFYNFNGQGERFFHSSNGSNPAGSGFYVLMPNGNLYAWNNISLATTLLTAPVADLSATNAYYDPRLLYQAQAVFVNDPVYDAKYRYGLYTAEVTAITNFRGQNEKYLLSGNGSNPAGSGYYVLMPNGNLYAYIPTPGNNMSLASTLAQAPVATLGGGVYSNTTLLYSSTGQALGVTATVDGAGLVTLTRDVAFAGSVRVTVTESDGAEQASQNFKFTVTDNAPTPPTINNVSVTGGTGTTVNFATAASDADGDTLSFRASISDNPLYLLKTQYGLNTADQFFNAHGQNEKYFHSSNGSNPAGSGYYVLTTLNKLYAWDGVSYNTTVAQTPVADFTSSYYGNANVYSTTSLLYNATTTPNLSQIGTANLTAGSMDLTWTNGFTGKFLVTFYVSDGAKETERIFLVTVS